MKKTSFLIYSLAGGGAERVVSVLLSELDQKLDITLVLMNDTISYDLPKNIKIRYLENSSSNESGLLKFLKLPLLGFKYAKYCKANNIEVSISFMNRSNYINIFAKLFGLKVKTIISERIAPSKEYSTDSFKDKVSRFLIRNLYPKADIIVPNAKEMASDLHENFSIPLQKLQVINNPVDIQKISGLKEESVAYGFQGFNFVNVARFYPQKNHKLLLKAFAKIKQEKVSLILLGDGDLRGELERFAAELGIKEKVVFVGFDNNPYKYLSKADCFILSSNYEGFPNVVVEALACSIPVISTDCVSGPSEILNGDLSDNYKRENSINISKYGILTPVDNDELLYEAMQKIIDDTKLQEEFRTLGYKRAQQFEKNKIVNEFFEVLNSK